MGRDGNRDCLDDARREGQPEADEAQSPERLGIEAKTGPYQDDNQCYAPAEENTPGYYA